MKVQVNQKSQAGPLWIAAGAAVAAAAGSVHPMVSNPGLELAQAGNGEVARQAYQVPHSTAGVLKVAGGRKTLVPPGDRKPLGVEVISDEVLAIHAELDARLGGQA